MKDIPAVHPTLERLRLLTGENPGLREAAIFYERLIPAMRAAESTIPAILIEPAVLKQKLLSSIPLLVGEQLAFDPGETARIMKTICTVIQGAAAAGSGVEPKAGDILSAIDRGHLDPLQLLMWVEGSQAGPLEETASRLGLDARLLRLAAENTLKVFLRAWRGEVERQVDLNEWQQRACPICGSTPALAEVREAEGGGSIRGQRFLRCLLCGAGWPYPNLHCAFCGNDDHKSLGILLIEEQVRRCYLHTCDRCKRYIKTVVTYDAIPADLLVVEDLATLPLDALANERGYTK